MKYWLHGFNEQQLTTAGKTMKIVEKWLFLVCLVLPVSGLHAEQSSSELNPAVYSQQL